MWYFKIAIQHTKTLLDKQIRIIAFFSITGIFKNWSLLWFAFDPVTYEMQYLLKLTANRIRTSIMHYDYLRKSNWVLHKDREIYEEKTWHLVIFLQIYKGQRSGTSMVIEACWRLQSLIKNFPIKFAILLLPRCNMYISVTFFLWISLTAAAILATSRRKF